MLQSIDALLKRVSGPLSEVFGSHAKIISVEIHGNNVEGIIVCPGKVIRYVFDYSKNNLKTYDLLTLKSFSKL